ncbi:MAG: YbaB/EbfC family nucleoid-associated protein [Bacilli bacterium]
MNIQQMMMQAQKMQRELKKAKEDLAKKEFTLSKSGLITVVMTGDYKVQSINIEEDGFEADNKEMIEELIASTINELYLEIKEVEEEIEEKITGRAGGLGF